jgi:Fe-S cluster biogenesis protein NfuA/nitrite reductase/ring-hydroxylating ferredoxin subunit
MSEAESTTAIPPDELSRRVQELEERLAAVADPYVRELADELVATVMDLYGEGLAHVFEALADGGEPALAVRDRLADDGLVSSLLLIHGLHPVPLAVRVEAALESVRPYLHSHSGGVELLELDAGGVAHLRLKGSCDGCPSSAATLELAIRQALDESAPDLAGIEVEGVVEQPRFAGGQLPLLGSPPPQKAANGWTRVEGVEALQPDAMLEANVDGAVLLIANVGGTLLAYRNECAGCGSTLGNGTLEYGTLSCAACGRSFQLPLAGRLLGGTEDLQLTPVPLLAGGEGVRVAVAA